MTAPIVAKLLSLYLSKRMAATATERMRHYRRSRHIDAAPPSFHETIAPYFLSSSQRGLQLLITRVAPSTKA